MRLSKKRYFEIFNVQQIAVSPFQAGQTAIMDRYYQCHKNFDLWQIEGKYFACRIRNNTKKTCIKSHAVKPNSVVFYDAIVLLGTPGVNQTEKVGIKRVRKLRIKIQNEARNLENDLPCTPCLQTGLYYLKEQKWRSYEIT